MTVGTKSLLFGIHQFILHPIYLAMAWNRLYGFPKNPILWFCFIVHDWGYWGKTDMDGPDEGQTHPELGAKIVGLFFGLGWANFCLYHSRFYARAHNEKVSKLCCADKLAFCFYPPRVYCFLATLTGEMKLYRSVCEDTKYFDASQMSNLEWYHALKRVTLRVTVQTNRTYRDHVGV